MNMAKIVITSCGFDRHYNVKRSRDEKMNTTEVFQFEVPLKPLIWIPWEVS